MARRRIGRGWANEFGREPQGVYQSKERERTASLVDTAMKWKYGEEGGIQSLGQMSRAAFIEYDRKNDPYVQAGLPALPTKNKDKDKGPFGGLKSIGSKALAVANRAVQDTYIKPNMAAAKGIMAGLEKTDALAAATPAALFTRGEVNAQGQYGTKRNLIGNPIKNVQSHIRAQQQAGYDTGGNPIVAGVQAQMRAGRAFQRDEDIAPGIRIGATAAANPLSYAGPGVVSKLPLVRRSAQAGGIAGAIFETPLAMTAGATAGAAGAAQWGEHIPGLKEVPEQYRPLVGGVIGGVGPAGLKYAARKARNIRPQDLLEEAPAPGVTRKVSEGDKFRHGTTREYEGLPEPRGGEGDWMGRGAYTTGPETDLADHFAGTAPPPGKTQREGGRIIPMRAKRDVELLLDSEPATPDELNRIRGALSDSERVVFDGELDRLRTREGRQEVMGHEVRNILSKERVVGGARAHNVIADAGFGGWETPHYGDDTIQAWARPSRDLRSEFEEPSTARRLADRAGGMLRSAFGDEAPAADVTRRVPEGEKFRHGTTREYEGLPEPRGDETSYLGRGAYTAGEGSTTPNKFAGGAFMGENPPRQGVGGRVIPMQSRREVDLILDDELITPSELEALRRQLPDAATQREFDRTLEEMVKRSGTKGGARGYQARMSLGQVMGEHEVPGIVSRAGFAGWEGDYGDEVIQSWANPKQDLRSEFELPEVPKPTVKRPDMFGNVEDTLQTEAELNGWREQQGALFDRGAAVNKPKPAPKGQRSLFDLFDEGNDLAVAPRRQRMAGQEGNQPVRMRGDQIAEALGKSPEEINEYKRLDQSIRDASGKPDTKHGNFPRREEIRKAWTQEYIDRNGRQPVFTGAPGARAARYAEIDRRVAAGEPTTDTGGEFEGFFDTASARRSRIMQLEKIASDPTVKPEMRERARLKLAEEQGAELTGRQPGDTGIVGPEEPGLGRSILKAATGPSSPAALAARGAAGFVQAKVEGEDNSEALKRGLLSAMPAGVGRAALRASGGLDEAKILGAVARSGDEAADGPKVSLKSVDLAHNEITEKPELFQGRDADPGLTYKESRVESIMEKFDPNRLEPGLVAKDVNTGEHVVIRGHHRLEVMKRKAAAGELAERSDWQVIEADLTNPADIRTLKRMARVSNFSTAETNLREKLDAVRILREDGEDIGSIQQELRMSSVEIDDLDAIDRGVPDDLVDRLTEMGKTQQESAAEIAKIALRYNLKEADVRAAIARYVINPEKALTRAKVRASMEAGAQAYKEAEAVGLQGGLFPDDTEIETVLRAVDELKAKEDLILKAKRQASSLVSALTKRYQGDPRGDFEGMARAIIDDAQADIVKLELEIEELKTNFANRNRPVAAVDDVLPDDIDRTPMQAGPGMFDEELPPVPQAEPPVGRATPQALPDLLRPEGGRVITGTGEGEVGDLLARAPEVSPEPGAPMGARTVEPEGPFGEPEWPQRPGAPVEAGTPGAVAPEFEDLRYSPAAEMGERGAVPGAGRAAGQEALGDVLAPEDIGRTGAVPTAGRAAGQGPLGDVLAPSGEGRVTESLPNEGQQAGLAHVGEGERTRYVAEIDTTEAERINQEWAGISEEPPKLRESGNYLNKILIEWPAAASRAMFTASTSGDLGSGLIQGAYQAWTHPLQFAKSFARSMHSFGSEGAREGARVHVRNMIEEAAPEGMKASVFDDVFKAGGAFSKRPEEYVTDVGSAPLEKIPVAGAYFRGTRRQFETQTEIMRAQALANIFRNQRAKNIANGLGDTIQPDQLRAAVNVANHLTGATKMGMNPAAGIAFGAPRFMFSQFGLLQDAFLKNGVAASYARKELMKTFGMIVSATAVANMVQSKGKDVFGPGLGNPQDIESWEDAKDIITSPNFGRVRVGDSDISLFGPLDPLARAFFQELANVPDVLAQAGVDTRGLGTAEDAVFPGTAAVNYFENKASPLVAGILAVKAGENKFTGKQYEDFGDYFMDNMERVLPIFSQNAIEAFKGEGSWVNVGAEFVGLKSSPTTPYERAVGILDSIPGEYWVVDAKNNQLRPPNTVYELSPKQRDELRKTHPEIDLYLRKRENDPNKTFIQKLSSEYASTQSVWDAQLENGQLTTDAWRRQFIANQKQLRTLREQAEAAGEDFESTTQRDVDLDSYFAIWDDPAVDGEKGLNYEEAERQINALRARVGDNRWDALKETLAWNKSPRVTQYLTDMQKYNEFIGSNSKYSGVPAEKTRAVDAVVTRVRQLQASNPGLPGKYALFDMVERGDIDTETMMMARIALGRKYSMEYNEWKGSEDGERITAWFRPQLLNDTEITDFPTESSGGGGGAPLRSVGSRGSSSSSSRKSGGLGSKRKRIGAA